MNTLFFVLDTVFSIYLMIVLLRFWLQWARADFYNQLSQFCVKLTHPLLTPLRRVIPGFRGIDFASLLLAYAVAVLKFVTFMSLGILKINVTGLLLLSFLVVLKQAGSLLFWVLIARAILSWISQGRSPIEYVLYQLTEPLLSPIRRFLPSLGGLDLSVLVLFLILQGINFLMLDLVGPLWNQL
ncbi:MAG: YggT family protein [Tolumonas sp.]|nr:YggT family protein [Tolumonas sp.]